MLEFLCPGPDAVGDRRAVAQQPRQSARPRGRLAAIGFQARALLLALGVGATANGQALRPEQGDVRSARATAPLVRTGVAIHRGQGLHYEIIDGLAVHGGDMVLGSVEEVAGEHQRRRSMKAVTGSWPERRDLASAEDEFLWPGGVIPYVIEAGFSQEGLSDIEKAIHEWNSKTVITLVQRTTESDYVRFLPTGVRPSDRYCRAQLGRRGGEQSIWLRGPEGCGLSDTIHEIGHAVGLVHEHQRHDRDKYVTVSEAFSYGDIRFAFLADHLGRRPYDYSSVMHYRQVRTIPPGIPVRSERLSSGDIDGVARLYGTVPTATTITTNPAGLQILVDGESVTTPAQFDWNPGSTHTVQAVSPQTVGAERFVFGRWSDEGGTRRTLTADAESTWFEANYIAQRRILSCPETPEAVAVTVRPESRDGFHVQRQPVEVEAKRGLFRHFLRWNPIPFLRREADRRNRWSDPGASSNPASGTMPRWSRWSSHDSEITEFAATYAAKPVFPDRLECRRDHNPPGRRAETDPLGIPGRRTPRRHLGGSTRERSRGARLRRRPVSLQELERRRKPRPPDQRARERRQGQSRGRAGVPASRRQPQTVRTMPGSSFRRPPRTASMPKARGSKSRRIPGPGGVFRDGSAKSQAPSQHRPSSWTEQNGWKPFSPRASRCGPAKAGE